MQVFDFLVVDGTQLETFATTGKTALALSDRAVELAQKEAAPRDAAAVNDDRMYFYMKLIALRRLDNNNITASVIFQPLEAESSSNSIAYGEPWSYDDPRTWAPLNQTGRALLDRHTLGEELSEQQQARANDEEELEVVAINNMPPGLRRSLYESQLRRPREVEINELNFNAEVLFAKKELEIMLDSCTRYGTSGHGSGPFSPSNGVSLYHLLEHGFCWE